MQHRLSILVGRLEVVNRANPLNDFNGRFNLVYDLSHTLIGHGGFIQGIGNNTGRIDSFHLLLKLFHRESLKRRVTAHETTGAMRSGAVPFLISLTDTDEAPIPHVDGNEQLFSLPCGDGTLAQNHGVRIDIVVDRGTPQEG